jgi:type I restriction enzyme S subunit
MQVKQNYKQTEIGEIPSSWSMGKLCDYVKINPSRKISRGTKATYVGMADIQPYERKISNFITKPYKGGARFINNDTLLARITPCLENGKTAYVDILENEEIGFGSTEFIVLSSKQGKTISKFIYYLARSPRLRHTAIRSMVGSSGRQRVQKDKLENTLFAFPEINEQKEIASVLSSLDDKIELNRKMNQTLEEIGKALFRQWFVDFEFTNEEGKPYKSSGGEMVDSELGKVPKGWSIKNLKDFGKIVLGSTPSKKNGDYFGGEIPFIKIPDMHSNIYVFETEDTLTKEGMNTQKTRTLPKNSICVSCIATVGEICLTTQTCQTNQQINSIIPNRDSYTSYLFYSLKMMKKQLIKYASGGSATLNLNKTNFSNIKIIAPSKNILDDFETFINSLFSLIRNNSEESIFLARARNSLLPRLISGKLRVIN